MGLGHRCLWLLLWRHRCHGSVVVVVTRLIRPMKRWRLKIKIQSSRAIDKHINLSYSTRAHDKRVLNDRSSSHHGRSFGARRELLRPRPPTSGTRVHANLLFGTELVTAVGRILCRLIREKSKRSARGAPFKDLTTRIVLIVLLTSKLKIKINKKIRSEKPIRRSRRKFVLRRDSFFRQYIGAGRESARVCVLC